MDKDGGRMGVGLGVEVGWGVIGSWYGGGGGVLVRCRVKVALGSGVGEMDMDGGRRE